MGSPALCFKLLRQSFSFFDRRELCQLPNVCRRFDDIIEDRFADAAPYLLIDYIHHRSSEQSVCWKWVVKHGDSHAIMPDEVIANLQNAKFVRLNRADIRIDYHLNPMQFLKSISHIWEGARLWVFGSNGMAWTEFVELVSGTSPAHLNVCGLGSHFVLSQLQQLDSSLDNILIWDDAYDSIIYGVPISSIISFLFKFPASDRCRKLEILSRNSTFDDKWENLIETITKGGYSRFGIARGNLSIFEFQRFMSFFSSINFKLEWRGGIIDRIPNQFEACNNQTNQRLRLRSNASGFILRTL
ncbi:hypothetical protein Ddc_12730 [Ditylenchus destructor]|nr:hypothetical protein Ddc_12730 [Ditylenchus destructor]